MPAPARPHRRRWPWVLGGGLLLLGVVAAVALLRLDGVLLERARAEAAELSRTLGREVTVGDLSTRLLPPFAIEVEDLRIGPAPDEGVPLASLAKLEVGVEAWRALRSWGRDLRLETAAATGLVLHVVQLPGGETNVGRVLERLQRPPVAAGPQRPRDPSRLRIERAVVTDATVRFSDRRRPAARELVVTDVDVVVRDLRAGEPLRLELDAAVLHPRQNLHLDLRTAPLPPSLRPLPEHVAVKAQDVDLAALGPFLGPDVGLQAGVLRADWTADLGAAVRGGQGPTRARGQLAATGLRFAKAEAGAPLDVMVDTDLTADVRAGDLILTKLQVAVGPARLRGSGRILGLRTETPKFEDFAVTGEALDLAEVARFVPALRQAAERVTGPIGLQARGAGTGASQALTAVLDLTAVRLRVPGQLSKAAGEPLRLDLKLTGAVARGGALRFAAKADLTGVDLRPGGRLDKAPGQRCTLDTAGTFEPPRAGRPLDVKLSRLHATIRDSTLTGTASLHRTGSRTTFAVDLKTPGLDADALLLPAKAGGQGGGRHEPNRFQGLRGKIRLDTGSLRFKGRTFANVDAHLTLTDDLIRAERLTVGLFGGTVAAAGSTLRLGPVPARRPFTLRARVRGIDVAAVLAARLPRQVLSGRFAGELDLQGVGYREGALRQRLRGRIDGELHEGVVHGVDIPAQVAAPLARALPFTAKLLDDQGRTLLGNVPLAVRIHDGVATLHKPVAWSLPEATLRFEGGVRLDGTLALTGTIGLRPLLVRRLTRNRVVPTQDIELPLAITGRNWRPQVTGLDVQPAVLAIARLAGGPALRRVLGGKAGAQIERALERGPEKAAEDMRRQAEERARQEADKMRQRAEEQIRERLRQLLGQ